MDLKILFAAASIACILISYFLYIRDILQKKTKPHSFSWFIWVITVAISFAAQVKGEGGAGSWPTAGIVVGCLVCFLLSIKYGERTITMSDWICLVLALISVGLWVITSHRVASVVLATAIDIFAFYPTWRKSYHKPHEETVSMYILSGFQYLGVFLALKNYSFLTGFYPFVLVSANLGFAGMLIMRRSSIYRSAPAV